MIENSVKGEKVESTEDTMELNLTNKVNAKKNVDVNDPRYQLSDKLRASSAKSIRQTFTMYDNKGESDVSSNELTAAYALSDKKIPVGELLTKMTDLIVDLSDGRLDSSEDAIRAWKYARALLVIYADKKKRGETMTVFDNSLKNAVINCPTFMQKYPGKYTLQTNFYDMKVIQGLVEDIVETFEDDTVPKIHVAAMKQSRESAEAHKNPTLDRIVQWATQKYNCKHEAFYDINDDPETGLKYATNTVILHLKNGYDMSIIGYTGTEHDNQFSISVFDANSSQINFSAEKCSMEDLRRKLNEVNSLDKIAPISRMIKVEEAKNVVLREQYEILKNIRPMVPAEYLEIEAAESIVGRDYIWGCQNYRMTHEDLPADFSLDTINLPVFDESQIDNDDAAISDIMGALASAEGQAQGPAAQTAFAKANAGESVNMDDYDFDDKAKETQSFARSTLLPGMELVQQQQPKQEAPSVTAEASTVQKTQPIFKDAPLPTALTLPTVSTIPQLAEEEQPEPPIQDAVEETLPVTPVFNTQIPTAPVIEPPMSTPPEPVVLEKPEVELPPVSLPSIAQPLVADKAETPKEKSPAHGDIEDLFA